MPENNKKEKQDEHASPHNRDAPTSAPENTRKRRADDQLSPYSQDLFDPAPSKPSETDANPENGPVTQTKRAKARVNRGNQPMNKDALKGIFGKVSLTESKHTDAEPKHTDAESKHTDAEPKHADNGPKHTSTPSKHANTEHKHADDLMAGLNRSFLEALIRVVDRQSNKDLRFLFNQYEKFAGDIKNNNDAENKN